MLTDEQKLFYKKLILGAVIFLMLGAFVWLALANAGDVSYNTRTLSDVQILRSALEEHFYFHNQYPKDLAEAAQGLPLGFGLEAYAYQACSQDRENCEDPERRASYRLGYTLRQAGGMQAGGYAATPEKVLNR